MMADCISVCRLEYIEKCKQLIQVGRSVPQALMILQHVIRTSTAIAIQCHLYVCMLTRDHLLSHVRVDALPDKLRKQPMIQVLCEKQPMDRWLFDDWQAYLEAARGVVAQLPEGTPIGELKFRDAQPHHTQVAQRLAFLENLYTRGLEINREHMERIWTLFITQALTTQDRDEAFQWIARLRSSDVVQVRPRLSAARGEHMCLCFLCA